MAEAEGEEGTLVSAKAEQSVKCPLYLVSAILQDAVENGPTYDSNVLRVKSLLRDSFTKRMVRREVLLRNPKLILRHRIDAQGPHQATRVILVPIEEDDAPAGDAPAEDDAPAETDAPAEGDDAEPTIKTREVEEEICMAYVDMILEQLGPVPSELETVNGTVRLSAVETDEEMVNLAVDINYRTTGSYVPEGLDLWAESLVERLKTISEKIVYLNPSLANPDKFNGVMYRLILSKAKRFQFISQALMRSPSAQSCIRAGTAGGSLQFMSTRPASMAN